jgi:hypothetical protein
VVSGGKVDLTLRLEVFNNPALSGVLTFHGAPDPESIVRESVVHSLAPRANGVAALMRI